MLVDNRLLNLAKLMDVAQKRAEVHSGNLANANTPGFRARAVAFEDAFRQELATRGDEAARQVDTKVYEPRQTSLDNDGNDVSVDKEVQTLAQNTLLYNAYVTMTRGKFNLMNTAIRGNSNG